MRQPGVRLNVRLYRGNFVLWIIAATSLLSLGVAIAVYDLWQQANFYVSSDYAQVAGSLSEVLTPGVVQVTRIYPELGGRVEQGEPLVQVVTSDGAGQLLELASPKSGIVVGLYAREGQLTFEGQPLAVIADPSELWVVANYPESALEPIHVGQAAEVQLVVIDRRLEGHVTEILPESSRAAKDAAAGTVPIRIAVDGDLSGLYPGMAAYVKIRIR